MRLSAGLLIAYFVYATVGGKYLDCPTPNQRFFLPKDILTIKCTVTANLKRFMISQIFLHFYNRSWIYPTNLSYTDGQLDYVFQIPRENFSSENTAWFPKEPWTVYSDVVHTTGKIHEFQGILLDNLTEPILQWSLGTLLNEVPLGTNTSFFFTQSTCALDVVIIVPRTNPGDQIYFGVTKTAFADTDVRWFSMSNLCQGCQFLDLVLVNHYLLILMENKVFRSNFLLDKGESENGVVSFTEVFNIPNCMSVKKGQLIYTPQCHYRFHDDFQDDIVVLLYQCQTTALGTVTSVHLSSSATKFIIWTAVDFPPFNDNVKALAFNPQTDNLIVVYDSNLETIAEVHHVFKNLSVQVSIYRHRQFNFVAGSFLTGLFIHPISNFLYAFGGQVWLSSDEGLSFDAMLSSDKSDNIKVCKSGYEKGAIACVTSSNKILYSRGGTGRIWNVKPQNLSNNIELAFFDYMENLYAGYLEDSLVKTVKINVIDGIKSGVLNFPNPLMVQILSEKNINFYEYRVADGSTTFTVSSTGMLLTHSIGGSVVIKDLEKMDGSLVSDRFMVKLYTLLVDKLTPSNSTALSSSFDIKWNKLTHDGELNLTSGEWPADDVWKTIVVPYTASFLVTNVTGKRASVISVSSVQSMSTVDSGKWQMFDFRVNSWSLREDKCRHSLDFTWEDAMNHTAVDIDLKMSETINVSLGVSAPYEIGSHSFLYGYLSNPSIFQTRFHPSFSMAPLLEKLSVEIMPIINRKTVATLRVFAVGASMQCDMTDIVITIFGGCPAERMLVFVYPKNLSRENFLKPLHKDVPVIALQSNYRPPSSLGYGIPTSDNIYNVDPGASRKNNNFKISKETGRLKQCAKAKTRTDCGCTDRMRMTDEARYSDCKIRAFQMIQPAVLRAKFRMQMLETIVDFPNNYLIRIIDVNNRSIQVRYKKGASASAFTTSLQNDKRYATAIKEFVKPNRIEEYFEPDTIEIVMEGSGLYHLRAEIMKGLSFCPLYSEFQVYVTITQLQYPVPYVIDFAVALVLGGILFILALWYLVKHHYTPVIPSTGSKCRDLNMKNIEPLHPPHSVQAVSFSMSKRNRLSSGQSSAIELLESAKAQDLVSDGQPELYYGPQQEHAA